MRKCGDCQLCCKLLPVRELHKGANTRCTHQRTGKGCMVYGLRTMPPSCALWNCRWLVDERTDQLRRPDRSGYVIDIMPDFVTARNDLDGSFNQLGVLQIWVDPARPEAWREDRDLMEFIERMGKEEGLCALVRNGSMDAVFVAPPSINPERVWFFSDSTCAGEEHTPADFAAAGFGMELRVEER